MEDGLFENLLNLVGSEGPLMAWFPLSRGPSACLYDRVELALQESHKADLYCVNCVIWRDLQALAYDFQFYKQPVPVELPPVVLSVGRSIMHHALPLALPLNATQPVPSVEQVRLYSFSSITFGVGCAAGVADGT